MDDTEVRVRIGGRCINNMRYADDSTLLTESKEVLRKLVQTAKKESEKGWSLFKPKNIKILSTEKIDMFTLGDDLVQLVQGFIFLGSKIEVSGECGENSIVRIEKDLERQTCDKTNQEEAGE